MLRDSSGRSCKRKTVTSTKPPFIAANFEEGYLIWEVIVSTDDETVKVNYMRTRKVRTSNVDEHPPRFWYWPRIRKQEDIKTDCILPLCLSNLINNNVDNVDILHKKNNFCA